MKIIWGIVFWSVVGYFLYLCNPKLFGPLMYIVVPVFLCFSLVGTPFILYSWYRWIEKNEKVGADHGRLKPFGRVEDAPVSSDETLKPLNFKALDKK
jgi:hypothetical protein